MEFPRIFLHSADQEIISKLLGSDQTRNSGEEQFFKTYLYFVREGVQKYSLNEEEAFDAYSDSILSAIEKITGHGFEGRSSLKTWLYQIFHHKCVDLIRKKTTNKGRIHQTLPINEMISQVSDSAKSIVQKLIDKADWSLLRQKLNQLGENCRRLLMLAADGQTDKEIAVLMDYKTADVVKTSRLRCLEKLRQLYKSP